MNQKIYKAILSWVLILAMALSMAGCGGSGYEAVPEQVEEVVKPETTGVNIIENGASDYQIVIPEEADATTEFAASDLAEFLRLSTGVTLPIITDSGLAYDASAKYISLGQTVLLEQAGITITKEQLGESGYIIKTVDNSLFIAGITAATFQGTAYGIYDFLWDAIGMKTYAADEIIYDKVDTVPLYLLDKQVRPSIDIRCLAMHRVMSDKITNYRLRLIGSNSDVWSTFTHTLISTYLPAEKYAEAHPDWYANGNQQLCITNEEMIQELILRVEALLDMYPNTTKVMLGHEDNSAVCQCDNCMAVAAKYGGAYSGVELELTIKVAAEVDKWAEANYPGRKISYAFFAYGPTLNAPVTYDEVTDSFTANCPETVIPDNVGVLIAPIAMNFSKAPQDPENQASYIQMKGWTYLFGGKNISIWNYCLNAYSYFFNLNNFGVAKDYVAPDHKVELTVTEGITVKVDGYNDFGTSQSIQEGTTLYLQPQVNEGYEGTPVVTIGEQVLEPFNGWYVLEVTEPVTVTVNGVARKYITIADNPFNEAGTAVTDDIPAGYAKNTELNKTWASEGYPFADIDLEPYSEVKFEYNGDGWRGISLTGNEATTTICSSGDAAWREIRLEKNGEGWNFYYDGVLKETVTLPNNSLADLSFHPGGDPTTTYFTELKALTDLSIKYEVKVTAEENSKVVFQDITVPENGTQLPWGTAVSFRVEKAQGFGGNPVVKANDQVLTAVDGLYALTVKGDTSITVQGLHLLPDENAVLVYDDPFDGLAGTAYTQDVPEGYEKVTRLEMEWNKYGFKSLNLNGYKQVEFAVKSTVEYGVIPSADAQVIDETHNNGHWRTIKLVKQADSWNVWEVFYNDEYKSPVTLAKNNLNDLYFRLGKGTYYVTELRGVKDPSYVYTRIANVPFPVNSRTVLGESLEGYEYITTHKFTYGEHAFRVVDLNNYIEVKFAVKSTGYYCITYNGSRIDETDNGGSWLEIKLVKIADGWDLYYGNTFKQTLTLANNKLTDLKFQFGNGDFQITELMGAAVPGYTVPVYTTVSDQPIDRAGTISSESILGYDTVTQLSTSWDTYKFKNLELTPYTRVKFAVYSEGSFAMMYNGTPISEKAGFMEIELVKSNSNWDLYYNGEFKQTLTLANNNLTDLNFRFGDNTYHITELKGIADPSYVYVSPYVQVAANFINKIPTSTTTEGLPSRDANVVNITNTAWVDPGVVDGVVMADYTELKFWYKVSNGEKWFEMFNNGTAFYQGNATEWTEMKFVLESNGTWTLFVNGEGKKYGLTGTTLKDVISELKMGGQNTHDVYVTDLIGLRSPQALNLPLVQNNATSYSIVYENGSGETFAAEEMRKYFNAATGLSWDAAAYTDRASLPTLSIVIGQQPAADAGLSFAKLTGPSDYIITNQDRKLYIYGNTEQGTVNGVYAFLEAYFGVEVFYKDTYTVDPLSGDLVLEPFTTVGNAKFDYLYSGYGELRPDKNGGDRTYAYMMGTVLDYEVSGAGIHNALGLISQEEYGASHPNWFYTGTTADGYNTGTQLYLAVDDFASGEGTLVSAVAQKLYTTIQNNPDLDIFGFSPMDIDIWPTGTDYEKSDDLKTQYGTNAAEYILFMNAVAQELENKVNRPITLQLLAYNKTLVAPSGLSLYNGDKVKVVPYVAPVESNFHMTFADSRNLVKNPLTGVIDSGSMTVAQVIEGWDAISSEIHLWWYSSDAYCYFMPLNSYDNMGTNYQFAYEHGVTTIFHQSQFDSAVSTDWSRMKIYLQRELAKDPYANVSTLIDKFMNAYFGAGASNMKKLMDSQRTWYGKLLTATKQDNGSYWLGTLRGSAFCTQDSGNRKQWTTYQLGTQNTMLTNWVKYCNNAKTAINNDSSLNAAEKEELCKRVDLESLPARYVLLKVFGYTGYDASMEAFLQAAKTLGVTYSAEGTPIA